MLQTLESASKEEEKEIKDIIANSEQVVMRNEQVYFILNKKYKKNV